MGPDYLITLPSVPLPPLAAMFERYREKEDLREATFSKGTGYLLYKIVDTSVDASFPMLRKMAVKLDRLEDDIFEGKSSEIVRDISEAKQEIINFRRIVRPQRAVLRDLERTKQRYLQEELEIYFDDISDAAERIWDTLENYKEVIEALESTNESVLSHRLNDSFRILTAASVVLLPLTLIASIFGMNVPVPGEGQEFAFLGILVVDGDRAAAARRLFPAARLAVGWLAARHPRRMGAPRPAETPGFRTVAVRCRPTTSTDPALAAGRLAYERHAWGEAYESLTAADAAGDLGAEDLERLGVSAYLTGRPERPPPSVRAPISRRSATGEVELADPRRHLARDGTHAAQRDGPGGRLARARRRGSSRRRATTAPSAGGCSSPRRCAR